MFQVLRSRKEIQCCGQLARFHLKGSHFEGFSAGGESNDSNLAGISIKKIEAKVVYCGETAKRTKWAKLFMEIVL